MSFPIQLTLASPSKEFTGGANKLYRISTSGVIGTGATIKLQHRNDKADDWVDHPDLTFEAETHLSGILSVVALHNRVVVESPAGNTQVNLVL